ncbi:MAG: radical SAM protein [Alphaproteobacteria bacterium]|nr:radical SAM protein [Alphaproteobacteria bacterium]
MSGETPVPTKPRAEVRPEDARVLEAYELRPRAGHIPRATSKMPVAEEPGTDTPWIGPHGEVMERLELHLTYHCPERCVFCSEEHRMAAYHPFSVTWGRVAKVLRLHASRGVKSVHFTGGEPTIHPQFIEACTLARKLGMRTSIGTIGTRLADLDFARRAVPVLSEALFSLHGPNPEVNDRMTRRQGSFAQTVAAMRNTLEVDPDFDLFVNTVVTKLNVDALPDTVALADELGAKLIIVSNTTPEGGGLDKYAELGLPLSKIAEIMPQVPPRAKRAIVRFFGMPMCLLRPYDLFSNDLHWDPRVTVEWASKPGKVVFEGQYNWEPNRKRQLVEPCRRCSRNGICMGVYDRYAELYDTSELRPYGQGEADPG